MYRRLLIYAKSALGDSDAADEVVQDTFQLACEKIENLQASLNPDGWLMKALKFVILNKRRKLYRENALFIAGREPDENIAAPPQEISVEWEAACIEILGEEDYKLLRQVALKQSTIREAAEDFGLSEDSASKRIQRGKKKLRKIFEKDNE